jgi:hypothetical protein
MPTRRLLPPVAIGQQTLTVNGRSYTGQPGSTADIVDFDADMLAANGWLDCGFSGPTSARPTTPVAGQRYVDTQVGAVIVFDGALWRNILTGSAV